MIVTLGDVHNYDKIIPYSEAIELSDCDLIQVGDFGVGMNKNDSERLQKLNDYLVSKNIYLHVMRGNHDDPLYFMGSYRNVYSNIDFIPDYTIKQIQHRNILFVGGAISVDRKPNPNVPDMFSPTGTWPGRKLNVDYWADEVFVFDEEEIRAVRNIDTVITHTAPAFVLPLAQFRMESGHEKWFQSDPELEEELYRERSLLSDMYFILKQNNTIKNWAYGHFHFYNKEEYNGTIFRLLDIMEFEELR